MAAKLSLIAPLAAALIICATAELPTDGSSVWDSAILAPSLEDNMAEMKNIREKKEAIRVPQGKNTRNKNGKKTETGKPKTKGAWKENNEKSKNTGKRKGKNRKVKNRNKKKEKKAKKSKIKSKKGKKLKNEKNIGKRKEKKDKKESRKNKTSKKGNRRGKTQKKGNRKSKTSKKGNIKGKTSMKGNRKGKTSKKGNRKGKKAKKGNRKSKPPKKGNRRNKISKNEKKTNKKTKLNRRKNTSKKGPRGGQPRATVNLTCLRDAITYTKFLKDNVINFLRRNTRLEAQTNLTNKKAAKKGEFKEPAARLIQAGKGDKQNLSCSGSTSGVGAKRIKSVFDILDGCEVAIKKACKPPAVNQTELDNCKKNAIAFNTTVSECITKATKGQDACSCFQDAAVVKEKAVLQSCKGTSQAKAAAKARSACLKQIVKCKNASTNAAVLQYACSYSTDHLIKTLKQLTANLAAFTAFLDKIKSLTGLSPSKPKTAVVKEVRSVEEENEEDDIFDSHQARLRGKRQQVACSSIVVTITTCTTTISNTPARSKVVVDCKAPTYTITACTDDDKTNIQTALNDAIEKNGIIIAFIASVTAELEVVTGSTPTTLTTAKAAARSRSILRKMIMEKMQLHN